MDVKEIRIIGGFGKAEQKEPVGEVVLKMGDVISIVGPTGSGKTAFINDIELFADENTPSRRKVLINGKKAPDEFTEDPSKNPIALITQHTNFLSDLPVNKFLEIHARIRRRDESRAIVEETLDFANQLTGESIIIDNAMTELSGGQTRPLLIADAVVIGNSPIILLDEIENAGIDRAKALALLKKYEKIFIFVTHDVGIILHSDFRIAMKNGAMERFIVTSDEEKQIAKEVKKLDDVMIDFRDRIRGGESLKEDELRYHLRAICYFS